MNDKSKATCGCSLGLNCGLAIWMNDKIESIQKGGRFGWEAPKLLLTMIYAAHKRKAFRELGALSSIEELHLMDGPLNRVAFGFKEFLGFLQRNRDELGRMAPDENCKTLLHRCQCGHWNEQSKSFCGNCSKTVPVLPHYAWAALALLQDQQQKKGKRKCRTTTENA